MDTILIHVFRGLLGLSVVLTCWRGVLIPGKRKYIQNDCVQNENMSTVNQ